VRQRNVLVAATIALFAALAGGADTGDPNSPRHATAASRAGAGAVASDANAWTFAVVADNRRVSERPEGTYEAALAEIRDMTLNPEPKWPAVQFVVGCGDINLAADDAANWKLWLKTFERAALKPGYYPVIGNWDNGDEAFSSKTVLPAQKGVQGNDPANYAADFRNVRLVVASDANHMDKWIRSAGAGVRHIFVSGHYPLLPHIPLDGAAGSGSQAWKMLVKHRDRVRAYLCGHTHNYGRARSGDVWQIDAGNAGRASHSDGWVTVVLVRVTDDAVDARVLQAPHARPANWRLADHWRVWPAAVKAGAPTSTPALEAVAK
jgi:predicted phosphodiesterase